MVGFGGKRVLKLNCSFVVNKIIIISHLRNDDAQSGLRLYEDLNVIHKAESGLEVSYIDVMGIGDFLFQLEKIFKLCKWQYLRPILHFECHGDRDKGLEFRDGFLSWKYFGDRIREINYATDNNLFVSLATCFGINSYAVTLRHDRLCPAWYMVAPDERVEAGRLLDFYLDFYSVLSRCSDMELIEEVTQKHGVAKSIYSSRFIVLTVARYLNKLCRGKGKASRVEDMVNLSKWMNADVRVSSIRKTRSMAKDFFRIDERVFIDITRRFLLDEERAGCSWEELKAFLG